jgi:hypothetical protein
MLKKHRTPVTSPKALATLIKTDGSKRKQITPYPISTFLSSSPDGRWLIALAPASDRAAADTMAIPTEDGRPHRVCRGFCPAVWASNRKTLYIALEGGKTVAIPVSAGEFPEVPAGLVESPEKAMEVPGARLIDKWNISPSPDDPSTFAWVKTKAGNRNLFRISLR